MLLHTATHCYTRLNTATYTYTHLHQATRCYTQLHTAAHIYTQLHTFTHCYTWLHTTTHSLSKLRTGSDKHNIEIRKKKGSSLLCSCHLTNAHKIIFTNNENYNLKIRHLDVTQHTILGVWLGWFFNDSLFLFVTALERTVQTLLYRLDLHSPRHSMMSWNAHICTLSETVLLHLIHLVHPTLSCLLIFLLQHPSLAVPFYGSDNSFWNSSNSWYLVIVFI
jgi:hypothetical protein